MKIAYEHWNPNPRSLELVGLADEIIQEYEDMGYILTLRQLYYQFVARDIIPNSERSYKNLGSLITKARMSGMISWTAIEDRNRSHFSPYTEEDVLEPIFGLPDMIQFDYWARQDTYVEVWVEKEALGNVIERACEPFLVPHMACKGYLSASEAWRAGQRFSRKLSEDKDCIIVHLGDHDPSGLDMTRDNQERISMFAESWDVEVIRLALNMDQVQRYRPPPNPTKVADSRASGYIKRFGHTSWELDAIEPGVLANMIKDQIQELIDPVAWADVARKEKREKSVLRGIGTNWQKIRPLCEGQADD